MLHENTIDLHELHNMLPACCHINVHAVEAIVYVNNDLVLELFKQVCLASVCMFSCTFVILYVYMYMYMYMCACV